jgi:dephospho-CoA kinase
VQRSKTILAFVGMPGAGKSEAAAHLQKKGIPFIRFGQVTDDGLLEMGLTLTPDNEKMYREKIRKELGMAAYAIKSTLAIEKMLSENDLIVIDGLYSWEEYIYLKQKFPYLTLIHVFAEPVKRYERLSQRNIRPVLLGDSYKRDVAELENLNKGGPIAIADYMIENNTDSIDDLYKSLDALLDKIGI